MARLLDEALLAQLEAAWQAQGAEIGTVLAAGLSDEAMTALVEPLGLTLPEEARRWWGWHDGVTVTTPFGWDIGADVGFYSLAQAIEQYHEERSAANEGQWPDAWLPLTYFRNGPLVIACSAEDVAVVHRVNWGVGVFPGGDSMGEVVALWIEMIETGAWSWNHEGYWDLDRSRAPERAQGMHVV
ncbi:MAG TPA: SMI1/KNR4 family protein [Baekduia sp.]|nr:SMI1/KNR4 family protein [Baekduia sp.]